MIRRPPRSTPKPSSAASDVYKRQGMGVQYSTFSRKGAQSPLVSFGLEPDQHFDDARISASGPMPFECTIEPDDDITYVAHMMCGSRDCLSHIRQEAVKDVWQLKHRWSPVTKHIRKKQSQGVGRVTRARDIGLLALLVILLIWPDATFARSLVFGFTAVGHYLDTGVYARRHVP